jgi:hypothetical protein
MFTNVMFYVAWVAAFLFSSVLVLIPQTLKKKIIACFLILVVTFGIATLLYKQAEWKQERWNNGICECGGTYELSAASQYRSSKTFYYTCDNCGHTEEFSSLMK